MSEDNQKTSPESQINQTSPESQINQTSSENQSDMDVVIIVDKDKLPEELRDKFPQDLQDKLLELLHVNRNQSQGDKQSSTMFAVQHGSVVGNVYKDGIFPEEKHVQKVKIKQEDGQIILQDKIIPKKENDI